MYLIVTVGLLFFGLQVEATRDDDDNSLAANIQADSASAQSETARPPTNNQAQTVGWNEKVEGARRSGGLAGDKHGQPDWQPGKDAWFASAGCSTKSKTIKCDAKIKCGATKIRASSNFCMVPCKNDQSGRTGCSVDQSNACRNYYEVVYEVGQTTEMHGFKKDSTVMLQKEIESDDGLSVAQGVVGQVTGFTFKPHKDLKGRTDRYASVEIEVRFPDVGKEGSRRWDVAAEDLIEIAAKGCFSAVRFSLPVSGLLGVGIHFTDSNNCKCPEGYGVKAMAGDEKLCHGQRQFSSDQLKGKGCDCQKA